MGDPTPADSTVLQANLSLALERITDGFFALDAQWRIAYMNAEARKLLRARDDVAGQVWLEAFPKARGRLFEREYQRAMREQLPVQFVEYSKTAECWFEVKAYPAPEGISVYFRDVTARIEAQREIDRNVARQQALIDFGRLALTGIGYHQLTLDASEVLHETLETPVVEIYDVAREGERLSVRHALGWPNGANFNPSIAMVEHLHIALHSGEAFVTPDVRIDPRARSLAAAAGHGGLACISAAIGTVQQPIGAIAVYASQTRIFTVGDVRFVEAIAQALAEAATASESNRRMAQVLESIRDAFVAVDRDLRITYVNERMAAFWQTNPRDMIGMGLEEFTAQFDDPSALEHFRSALMEDRMATFESQFRERWYEVRLHPFSDGVAGYVADISRRKREQQRILQLNIELERRVAERTRQLELANGELESFSYSVSHDLRAPLRAIDGFSQALAEDYNDRLDDRGRNYLTRVRKAALRMADLIDALLKLARVARAIMSWAPIDLSAIAEAVVADLRESEPDRRVHTVVAPGLRAQGEAHLMDAALGNLIGNAWKFTRNTPDARIEVGVTSDGAEFFVRDNGAGFDMTYGNKLFGAFQRLHSADEYEGTGIGLATVARVIHRHGGSIRAEGAVGSGATFYFTLPARTDGTEDSNIAQSLHSAR